jgi:hypothetical protein
MIWPAVWGDGCSYILRDKQIAGITW